MNVPGVALYGARVAGARRLLSAATLNLDFTTGQLDPRIDFSRLSGGTRRTPSGIEYVGPGLPRFDWSAERGAYGLLVEEQRTNLSTWSQRIRLTDGWICGAVLTENAETSPDGQMNATRLDWSSTGQAYRTIDVFPGTTYTWSYYVKRGTKINNRSAVYDSIGQSFIVSSFVVDGTSQSSWYRVVVTFTAPSGCTQVRVYPDRADSAAEFGSTFIWQHQIDVGSSASSPIYTEGAAATRTPDIAQILGDNFASFWNPAGGTLFVDCDFDAPASAVGESSMATASTGVPSSDQIRINRNINGSLRGRYRSDAVDRSISALVGDYSKRVVAAYAFGPGRQQLAANGVLSDIATAPQMPPSDRLALGTLAAGSGLVPLNGRIYRVAYIPRPLSPGELAQLTAPQG